ncbi:MAG TPA: ABC transporter substrate-binding protein [Pseudolabrys sp.]|nr:ABC transporter substrate-binding protein [Pseudolabrys sp.]
MRRREFIAVLGGAVTWPLKVGAQPAGMRRVGVLINLSESDLEAQRLVTAFQETLAGLGWIGGRNLRLDYRWASGDVERVRAFAKELVKLSPDIIVGYATPSVLALQSETSSIPIVFLSVTDPIGQGLVANLAHPGGNITGFSVFEFSLGTKWMEALKQIAPNLKRVTTIFNPKTAPYYALYLSAIEKAASTLAVELTVIEIHDTAEIERALNTLAREPDSGLIVMPDSFNMAHRQTIITFADRHHLPAIYYFPLFAADGGLISYGPDETDMFRRAAGYVDRILKGTKVSDLPVQQPTSFRLVINRKTANASGIQIPVSLLARADEVIE